MPVENSVLDINTSLFSGLFGDSKNRIDQRDPQVKYREAYLSLDHSLTGVPYCRTQLSCVAHMLSYRRVFFSSCSAIKHVGFPRMALMSNENLHGIDECRLQPVYFIIAFDELLNDSVSGRYGYPYHFHP